MLNLVVRKVNSGILYSGKELQDSGPNSHLP